MGSPEGPAEGPSAEWLALSRRALERAREALAEFDDPDARARETWRGQGGDMALAIDRAAEDAVLGELRRSAPGVSVVSEERGAVDAAGGGTALVVVDPIDGSLNAKRDMPWHALSIAIASGKAMSDVDFGYVATFDGREEWWAGREAGGLVAFPDAGGDALSAGLDLDMRSRVIAAPNRALLDAASAAAG
jgi:myo-inositol-1(or 4)-monophosphatase